MRRPTAFVTAILVTLAVSAAVTAAPGTFESWVIRPGQPPSLKPSANERLPVGSLQKPFIVRAWARAHAEQDTPRFTCTRTSGCWRPSGHGTVGLRDAIRESCNTYFKMLARETPADALAASFREAGFTWQGAMTDGEAIGLPGPAKVAVTPADLLQSYIQLVRTPWAQREDVRGELLAGLRGAANDGTASGLRLWGFMAKTGTVPAIDGTPLKTSGFAMVLDDAGFAYLGFLPRGTGRETAIRAGVEIAKLRPASMSHPAPSPVGAPRPLARVVLNLKRKAIDDPVRVQMLDELRLKSIRVKNVGAAPVDSSRGFVGPRAVIDAQPGDHFAKGEWRIESTKPRFTRGVRGSIDVVDRLGAVGLVATMQARDYANGILKAELGPSAAVGTLRSQLTAAALRFLLRGPRHGAIDVCDSTHCAWFVGEGPVPRWLRPDASVEDASMAGELSDAEWATALDGARAQPDGPSVWTADCGGDSVSPHFIWGNGDRRVTQCPRHPKGHGKVWHRAWKESDIAAVFGVKPDSIAVTTVDGQWMLKVALPSSADAPARSIGLTYDEAHRRLAQRMGWDAMPAPASRVSRSATGFLAAGVGFGHRVGLCLAP
ncbi:MAG: hypothetical protein ABI672_03335 [Vicinamibacteria bacterium]